MKSDLEAEMTMLVLIKMGSIQLKSLKNQEKELKKLVKGDGPMLPTTTSKETGDYEGAERIRSLSGWKKYYYEKARS